jgi:hypothetical protein
MPVEVNYFAWANNKGKSPDFASFFDFVRGSIKERTKSGQLIAQIIYKNGFHPHISYEFYADDEDSPIIKLVWIVVSYRIMYEWNEVDVPIEIATEIDQKLRQLPRPNVLLSTDISWRNDYERQEYIFTFGQRYKDKSFLQSIDYNYIYFDNNKDGERWHYTNHV